MRSSDQPWALGAADGAGARTDRAGPRRSGRGPPPAERGSRGLAASPRARRWRGVLGQLRRPGPPADRWPGGTGMGTAPAHRRTGRAGRRRGALMPGFTLSARCRAPVEDVWKLLFDPARFPDWWVGIETVRKDAPGEFTQWPAGYPDFPMPQKLRVDQANERVTISCQVSDIDVVWQLAEAGTGTSIHVNVSLPQHEAHRLDGQQQVISESLRRLTALAEAAS